MAKMSKMKAFKGTIQYHDRDGNFRGSMDFPTCAAARDAAEEYASTFGRWSGLRARVVCKKSSLAGMRKRKKG